MFYTGNWKFMHINACGLPSSKVFCFIIEYPPYMHHVTCSIILEFGFGMVIPTFLYLSTSTSNFFTVVAVSWLQTPTFMPGMAQPTGHALIAWTVAMLWWLKHIIGIPVKTEQVSTDGSGITPVPFTSSDWSKLQILIGTRGWGCHSPWHSRISLPMLVWP